MNKRAFLFLNVDGTFLGIAQRVQAEGHQVFCWYNDELKREGCETGEGMVKLVDDPFDVINDFKDKKNDLIILVDDNSQGDLCDYLQSEGWKVIGSSHLADELEHDRGEGNKLAETLGLHLPPRQEFTDLQSAKDYLTELAKKHPDAKLVFKGDGAKLAGGAKTYLSHDVADMLWFIDWIEKDQATHHYEVEKCHIQLVIDGLEVDYSVYFNGAQYAPALGVTFEQKRIHGLGAAQGCLGQIFCWGEASKEPYFIKYFPKLQETIIGSNSAEWAINNIIDEKNQPYFLEFTPRFGWDAVIGQLALLEDAGKSIADFFIHLADKLPFPRDYFPYYKYSIAVRLFSEGIGMEGKEVRGKPIHWSPEIEHNLWWYSLKMKDGDYQITDNPIGVATACGNTIPEVMDKVYAMLDPKAGKLITPDLFYSETIGENVEGDIAKLKKKGWLNASY